MPTKVWHVIKPNNFNLIHSWCGDKSVHDFPEIINQKVDATIQLGFELASNNVAV